VLFLPVARGCQPSDFRVKIEECIEALFELSFDLFARALKHVHGDVCLVAIGELQGGIVDLDDFTLGEEAHSVDKSQICHEEHLIGIREQGSGKRGRTEAGESGPVLLCCSFLG
jgi:hypothetical protein